MTLVNNWVQVTTTSVNPPGFPTHLDGFGSTVVAAYAGGFGYRSTDSGATMSEYDPFGTPINAANRISFFDSSTVYALCRNTYEIKRSTNAGVSWSTIGIPAVDGLKQHFCAVSGSTWFTCGDNGIIRRTLNAGSSWSTVGSFATGSLYGIIFVDSNNGWSCGENGLLVRTTDGGANWSLVTSGTTLHLYGIRFIGTTGVIALSPHSIGGGGTPVPTGEILRTTNGGSSWSLVTVDGASTTNYFQSITTKFTDLTETAEEFVLGSFSNSSGMMRLYRSLDGLTWDFEDINDGTCAGHGCSAIQSLYFSDATTCVLCTRTHGVFFSDNVLFSEAGNAAPTATVNLNTASPQTSDILTATATRNDADLDNVSLRYVWKKNGSTVLRDVTKSTYTGSDLTDTLDLSVVGNGSIGDVISVEVTPNDGVTDGSIVSDSATIINTPPVATVNLNLTTVGSNGTLVATATRVDADGHNVALTYRWKRNGTTTLQLVTKNTFTVSDLTDSLDLAPLASILVGDVISVEVTPHDGLEQGVIVTDSATVQNTLPAIGTTDFEIDESDTGQMSVNITEIDNGETVTLSRIGSLPAFITSETFVNNGTQNVTLELDYTTGTTSAGVYQITYQIVGDFAGAQQFTVDITVMNVNVPPDPPTNIIIPDGVFWDKGDIVEISADTDDFDDPSGSLQIFFYWSPTGNFNDAVLIGSSPAGGPHTINWDTGLSQFVASDTGAIFLRSFDGEDFSTLVSVAGELDGVPPPEPPENPTTSSPAPWQKGDTVTISVDVDSPTDEVFYYWSPTGNFNDAVLIGSTPAGGPHSIEWDTSLSQFVPSDNGSLFIRTFDGEDFSTPVAIPGELDGTPVPDPPTNPTTSEDSPWVKGDIITLTADPVNIADQVFFYWSPTGNFNDAVLIGSSPSGGPHTVNWDTALIQFEPSNDGAIFMRTFDGDDFSTLLTIPGDLLANPPTPPGAPEIDEDDLIGVRLSNTGIVTINWEASEDDTPSSGLRYNIQFSSDGGLTWTDVPGLTADLEAGVGLTDFGATSFAVDMSQIPFGAPGETFFRIRAWDGGELGNDSTVEVRFAPEVDEVLFSIEPPWKIGDIVTINTSVVNRNKPDSAISVEVYWASSGNINDKILIGATEAGEFEVIWDTTTYLPGNLGFIFVRAIG